MTEEVDVTVTIRLSRRVLAHIDEIAAERQENRDAALARAIRVYAEDYAEIREAEREMDEGKGIPHERVVQLVEDMKSGNPVPDILS